MYKGKFPFKRWIIKTLLNIVAFVLLLCILTISKLPELFDSYVYYKDFKVNAWLLLIIYRFCIYFIYPFIVSFLENIISVRRCVPYKYKLLENFNIQFFSYTLLTAVYALLGMDKVLGTDIFGSSDSFMFIGSFIFTLLINKSIPFLFYDGKVDDVSYDRKVYISVDLATIEHDSDPFSNSRNYLSYEYNNIEHGEELVVILKNPSKSFVNGIEPSKEKNCIDITTYTVMKTIDEYNQFNKIKYKRIHILNLFPEFTTEPENINKIYNFRNKENKNPNTKCYKRMHKVIEKKFSKIKNVLLAWGKNDPIKKRSFDIAVTDMKKHFQHSKFLEYDGNTIIENINQYPLHGQVWDKNKKSSEG